MCQTQQSRMNYDVICEPFNVFGKLIIALDHYSSQGVVSIKTICMYQWQSYNIRYEVAGAGQKTLEEW